MKSNFKVGDKVVCIDNTNILFPLSLKKGKVYIVTGLGYGTEIFIDTPGGSWKQSRFRLATLLEKELDNVD